MLGVLEDFRILPCAVYIYAYPCLPSRPQRPTPCQLSKTSSVGPQCITLAMSSMLIPIPNASVTVSALVDPSWKESNNFSSRIPQRRIVLQDETHIVNLCRLCTEKLLKKSGTTCNRLTINDCFWFICSVLNQGIKQPLEHCLRFVTDATKI